MKTKILKTEEEYNEACERVYLLINTTKETIEPNSPEGEEIELLSLLVENYEQEHHQMEAPDPIEAIKFRMEQMGMKQKDLAEVVGFKSRVSEILNKKRKLTLDMIRKLNTTLHIPTEVLIQDY